MVLFGPEKRGEPNIRAFIERCLMSTGLLEMDVCLHETVDGTSRRMVMDIDQDFSYEVRNLIFYRCMMFSVISYWLLGIFTSC